jgi:hypothetical protein
MLEAGQKEATDLVDTMHQLQGYLDGESKNVIQGGLDRLLSTVRIEAAKITSGSVVVLISPEGRATVDKTYSDGNSDSYLRRLKSQGFYILTLPQFSCFIQSAKSKVAEGRLIPVIKFLIANTRFGLTPVYSPAPTLKESPPHEPSSSQWKLSDFLPAPFPHPPLPRGLFKD